MPHETFAEQLERYRRIGVLLPEAHTPEGLAPPDDVVTEPEPGMYAPQMRERFCNTAP